MLINWELPKKNTIGSFQGYSRKMQPTQGISFPRSGHEVIFHIAQRYFGESFVYCDTNNKDHCGCESVPCINPDRTFAKCHDFSVVDSGGVAIIPSERYLVQYRSPVRSIASNYYLFRHRKLLRRRKSAWQKFALRSIVYWNRFVDKWVLNFPADKGTPLFCSYESIVSDPEVLTREVLAYLSDEPLDQEAIDQVLKMVPIARKNRIQDFKYYDAGFFREIESLTSRRMAKLGLPSFDDGI